MSNYVKIDGCRISTSSELIHILDLGLQPLANDYQDDAGTNANVYPLNLLFSPASCLIQIAETIDKNTLFCNYHWVTGTSQSTHQYAECFFSRVIRKIQQDQKKLVVEIASNDGTFLKPFANSAMPVIGVEPASNIAKLANDSGIPTLNEFWSSELAKTLLSKYKSAKIVIARNVIPHVSDLHSVIEGISIILDDKGTGVIEFHDACQIMEQLQYDSIYHEHLCYFTIETLTFLLEQYHLYPYDIDESPISGGSYVIYFSKLKKTPTHQLIDAKKHEDESGVNTLAAWQNFAKSVQVHKRQTLEMMNSWSDKTVVGFGSSARSQTYLNYCEFDRQSIRAIIDNNPIKQGKYTSGSSLPVVDIKSGLEMKPDIIFLLAWNFKDEIIKHSRSYGYQGPFLIPFPLCPYIVR